MCLENAHSTTYPNYKSDKTLSLVKHILVMLSLINYNQRERFHNISSQYLCFVDNLMIHVLGEGNTSNNSIREGTSQFLKFKLRLF